MRILYLMNYAGKGGSEKYVYELCEALYHNNEIFFAYNNSGSLCEKLNDLNIKVEQIKMNSSFDVIAAKKIAKFCKKNKIDVIHTHFQRENYLAILSKLFNKHIKVVYTSHLSIKDNSIKKLINSFICKWDDAVIAVCNLGKNLLIENKFPVKKIQVIYNGVSMPYQTLDINKTRYEFGISESDFVFVSLTRFTSEKGTEFLAQAVSLLTDKTSIPFKVILAGDGPLQDEVKSFCTEKKVPIIFTGFVADTNMLLAISNVYINSSSSEALSFAILEGMSFGLPIIATAVGGNIEIVNNETACGETVPFGDANALSDEMKNFMENKQLTKKYSSNSLKAVQNKFSKEISINSTAIVYENVLK